MDKTAYDSREAAAQVLRRMIKVTASPVKGAHDSQMVIIGGMAYIVYEANDVRPGENGEWPFVYCAMSVVNVSTLTVEKIIDIARPGQRFSNVTLKPGACFVPRILKRDAHTLRVFFVSMEPGVRQAETWYIDYSLSLGCFDANIYPVMLKTCLGSFPMEPRHFHAQAKAQGFSGLESDSCMYMFDVDKPFDGKQYVALNNFDTKQNALGVFNAEMDTVQILGNYNEPESSRMSESAVTRTPDGSWLTILRCDTGNMNYRFATSSDGINWSRAEEWPHVVCGSNSKPILEHINGVYLLGWQQQPFRSRFNIDISRDLRTWMRLFSFDDIDFSLQYPHLCAYDGVIYLCATHGALSAQDDRRDSIWFGPLISQNDLSAHFPTSHEAF